MEEFRLPKDGEVYTGTIIDRSHSLINAGIWGGISVDDLRNWLTNFTDSVERFFAARILDALVYRSKTQTESLIVDLFQRALPLIDQDAEVWEDVLRQLKSCPVRLVPVICENDPPSKSGPSVVRLVKRHLKFNDQWLANPQALSSAKHSKAEHIVFIDDFLGTGYQFKRFLRKERPLEKIRNARFTYAPLVAHQRGLDELRKVCPSIRLAPVEVVNDDYNLFAEKPDGQIDPENSAAATRSFYEKFLVKKKLDKLGRRSLGYGKLGLCLGFEHGTPNSSLPILWLNKNGFIPLLTR